MYLKDDLYWFILFFIGLQLPKVVQDFTTIHSISILTDIWIHRRELPQPPSVWNFPVSLCFLRRNLKLRRAPRCAGGDMGGSPKISELLKKSVVHKSSSLEYQGGRRIPHLDFSHQFQAKPYIDIMDIYIYGYIMDSQVTVGLSLLTKARRLWSSPDLDELGDLLGTVVKHGNGTFAQLPWYTLWLWLT